ncbi:MAG: sugar ABC transporter permease [Anaerolineales bacterium]|jgi:ABC-type sugar transport system permease subunit
MTTPQLSSTPPQMGPGGAAEPRHVRVLHARIIRTAYTYIFPAAVVMLLITFWPLIYQIWMSLTNYSNLNLRTPNVLLQIWGSFTGNTQAWNSPSFIGLGNYISILGGGLSEVLSGFDFWRILLFNLVWTAVNLFFSVAIGIALAMLINQKGFLFKGFYRALYILPWALPGLVSAMIWSDVFESSSGLLNQVLRLIGLPGNTKWLTQVEIPLSLIPPYVRVPGSVDPYFYLFLVILLLIVPYFIRWVRGHWLPFTIAWVVGLELFFVFALPAILNATQGGAATSSTAPVLYGLGGILPLSFYAALITNVWLGWPFMMVISTGGLQSIPNELYEAAEVDGATGWQSFWTITLPLLRPTLIPAIVISTIWTFNQFNVLYFTTGGGPLHTTEILVTEAYRLVNETTLFIPGVGNAQPYGVAAAFGYIVLAILVIITLITNRISRATESYAE